MLAFAAVTFTLLPTSPSLLQYKSIIRSAPAVLPRARLPIAFVEHEDDLAAEAHQASVPATFFTKTAGGLAFKDLEKSPEGEEIPADALIAIYYTATLQSSGEVIQRTGDQPINVQRGGRLDMFDEAIEGMRTGSKRRVIIGPESKFSALGDLGETVDFEITVVEVVTGSKKALYRLRGVANDLVNLLLWYWAAQLVLEATGVIPSGQTPTVDGQAVDAANAWAAVGLAQMGL